MPALSRVATAALVGTLLGGCALASQIGTTAPSGITQQLLTRSLERARPDLDLARIGSQPVALEVAVQAGNEAFVKWVRNRGQAELRRWAFDGQGNTVVDAPSPGVGRGKYDDFTIRLFLGFS